MAMNKWKVLSNGGKAKVIQQTKNGKKTCQEFGLINSMIQTIGKN